MADKAKFTVGVFAFIFHDGDYDVRDSWNMRVLVNVRTDQERQREVAGLPAHWPGVIVDLPGGAVSESDKTLEGALLREIAEETKCHAEIVEPLYGPFEFIDTTNGVRDLAFVAEAAIKSDPVASDEASEHRWVTWSELEAETHIRLPGKKGKEGRMAQMIKHCLCLDLSK